MPEARSLKSRVCELLCLGVAVFVLLSGGGTAHGEQGRGAKPTPPLPGVDQKLIPGLIKVVKESGPIFTAQVLRRSVRTAKASSTWSGAVSRST